MVHVSDLPQGISATIFDARETKGAGSTGVGKAMALAALGHPVMLHCALGRDEPADRIVAECVGRGIAMLVDRTDAPTPRHLNIMDSRGGRYSLFVEGGDPAPVIDRPRLQSVIAAAPVIFLSLCASSKAILPLLADVKADIHLDLHDYDGANPWYDDFIACADVIQLSDVALRDPAPVIGQLLAGRARQVVLTRGGAGAEIHTKAQRVIVPVVPARMVDSNGAGDAFSVCFWHAQTAGKSPEAAGAFAAATAAFAVECDGLFPRRVDPDAIARRAMDGRGASS